MLLKQLSTFPIVGLAAFSNAAAVVKKSDNKTGRPLFPYTNTVADSFVTVAAIVDFGVTRGAPKQYGSGILYGIPDSDGWQIPKHFYTEIGINHGRGGGSQVPGKGWVGGEADYVVCGFCWKNTRSPNCNGRHV